MTSTRVPSSTDAGSATRFVRTRSSTECRDFDFGGADIATTRKRGFPSVRLHQVEPPPVPVVGGIVDHIAECGNLLPQKFLHSSLECDLGTRASKAGAPQAH